MIPGPVVQELFDALKRAESAHADAMVRFPHPKMDVIHALYLQVIARSLVTLLASTGPKVTQ